LLILGLGLNVVGNPFLWSLQSSTIPLCFMHTFFCHKYFLWKFDTQLRW
jgi:hypothetical protein